MPLCSARKSQARFYTSGDDDLAAASFYFTIHRTTSSTSRNGKRLIFLYHAVGWPLSDLHENALEVRLGDAFNYP
jgi:hypothetical protein